MAKYRDDRDEQTKFADSFYIDIPDRDENGHIIGNPGPTVPNDYVMGAQHVSNDARAISLIIILIVLMLIAGCTISILGTATF